MSGEVVPIGRGRDLRRVRVHADDEERLTPQQLRAHLKISNSTLKRWRREGLPFEPWGPRSYRYVLSQVFAWRDLRFGAPSAGGHTTRTRT